MYISEIKIHGFKSFAKKEVIKLGPGITAVVGPNGCGKTNIVDAVRWVLGEQKYSILRSDKMEDVIFNGARSLKPLSVCQVTMTVNNNSGKLPIDYNDIEISRRIYRDGVSEYFLNKTHCRLKDISDLFIDTGMGADAYSVIELKMIEQILSENGEDRRKMFEEASGTHKYRIQRKSTIRKFERTQLDIERVNDIIYEVEQKVKSLDLQLKRYKRHSKLSRTLEGYDLELAYLQRQRLELSLVPLNTKIDQFNQLLNSKIDKKKQFEKELLNAKKVYNDQEKEIEGIEKVNKVLINKRGFLRGEVIALSEKKRATILNIERIKRERVHNQTKIETIQNLKIDYEKNLELILPTFSEKENLYENLRTVLDKKEIEFKECRLALDNILEKRFKEQRKFGENKSLFDRKKALLESKREEIEKLKNIIFKTDQSNTDFIEKVNKLKIKGKKIQKKIDSFKNRSVDIDNKLTNLNNEKEKSTKRKFLVEAELKTLKTQLLFYNELIETKEGFPDGTRFILENPKIFPDVLGTVADMFKVNQKYQNALEIGLGDLSHCLIAKNKSDALNIIDMAKKNKAGDFTIIPINELKNFKYKLKNPPKSRLTIGRASDLIQTSDLLKSLSEYLLGNLLIVTNLKHATKDKELKGWNLVDSNGSFFGKDFIFRNRQLSDHGHLLGRNQKIKLFDKEIAKKLKIKNKLQNTLEKIDNKIHKEKKQLEDTRYDLKLITAELSIIDNDIIRFESNHKQSLLIIENRKIELDDLKDFFEITKASYDKLKPKIDFTDKLLISIDTDITAKTNSLEMVREKRREIRLDFQNARIKLIDLKNNKDQFDFKINSSKETINELKNRQLDIKKELDESSKAEKEFIKSISNSEQELIDVRAKIQKNTSILDLKKSVFRDSYQLIEKIQANIISEQQNREKIIEDLKQAEMQTYQSKQKIELIIEKIRDKYNQELPTELVIHSTENELIRNIEKLKKSIESIGPVNMAVEEQFNEDNSRLKLLEEQKKDLISAEKNLRDTIDEIDRTATIRFQNTFEKIKGNFENLFQLFFEGGNASIELIKGNDPLDSEIGIVAQPPGKRNVSLRLLSSGEKALTAIALLFSIYQVKPSPYCILDEIDAPLDDINIKKFTRVLKNFSIETQFLIVTHNKLTMEMADYLYGVTQQNKGISKLVSVKLD